MEIVGHFYEVLVGLIREIAALVQWASDVFAFIELLGLMSKHGSVEELTIWLLVAALSEVVADALKSSIPTLLRLIYKKISGD